MSHPNPPRTSRPPWLRPLLISLAAVVALAIVAVIAVVVVDPFAPRTSAEATVGDGGFTASVDGVTVTGPAGVAPAGTRVTVTSISAPLPDDVRSFSEVVGTAVEVVLGDGLQPLLPLELTFRVDDGADPSRVFVLAEDESTGTGVAFTESSVDAVSGTVTAQVEHLSWFAPVAVDERTFSERVRDWIGEFAGTGSARPECFGVAPPEGPQFTAVRDDVVWPCLRRGGDGTGWELHSNSGLVWEVLTAPTAAYEPLTALTVPGILTAALANRLVAAGALEGDTVMLPLETLRGAFTDDSGGRFALRVEPGLSQLTTIMFGLSMILPEKWITLIERATCLFDVIKTATSSPSGESFRAILACAGSILAGAGGALIGIILTGPGLLATQLEGLARELMQTNTVEFRLGYADPNQVDGISADARWLYELPQESVPNPARQVSAVVPVDGHDVVFSHSSSVWVGCGGSDHEVWFFLDGNYSSLSFALGMLAHTPPGLTATFEIEAVGEEWWRYPFPWEYAEPLGSWSVTRGTVIARQTLPVDGIWFVIVRARTADPCGTADIGYGALLDAYVE